MNPYFEQMVLSASPIELIRLLYQRATSCVQDAREHLKNGRIEQRCASVNIAYAVLTELTSSLRADDAPDLTSKLNSLYAYMQQRLVDGNLKQDDEPLREVLGLLMTLSEAWSIVPDPWVAEAATGAGFSSDPDSPVSRADDAYRLAVSA